MRRKSLVVCEICGGTEPSGTADFLVFHCVMFCSPDCLDDYRAAGQEQRAKKEAALAQSNRGRSRAA